MNTTTIDQRSTSTAVFELVHFIDGVAVAYVPYSTGCGACCGGGESIEAAPSHTCCH